MGKINLKVNILVMVSSLFLMNSIFAQSADIIFINGKIFTADTAQLFVHALAIKGNKIIAVGTNDFVQRFASTKTKKIDLKGKTVVPGFNDAHDHLGWLIPVGQFFFTPFSVSGPSKAAVTDSLIRLAKKASAGQWIQGTIGLTVFNDTTIRKEYLDSISPYNPVALQIMWGHGMILNSRALKQVGIQDTASDPLSGWYERSYGTKNLTGALFEGTQFPIWQAITVDEPEGTIKALRAHANEELSLGITTVQNMSSNFQGKAARRFFAEANLPVRTRIIAMPGSTEKGRSLNELIKTDTRLSSYTYASGIKYVIDGTPLEQTALMTKSYPKRGNWFGRLNFPLDTIKLMLKEALNSNRQLMMHIVGDSATKVVIEMMKEMASNEHWREKRVRIEHGTGLLTNKLINDASDMGIIIVHTPQYGLASPLNDWLSKGINIAVGPDGVINPYLNILVMTTQQADPKQNLTREQAVMAYTKGAAYAEFTDNNKGMLTSGMLADLSVLSQDIFTIPSQQLPATYSIMTVIDGKIVYKSIKSMISFK